MDAHTLKRLAKLANMKKLMTYTDVVAALTAAAEEGNTSTTLSFPTPQPELEKCLMANGYTFVSTEYGATQTEPAQTRMFVQWKDPFYWENDPRGV